VPWTLVEALMKGMTFAGVLAAALLITRPGGPGWARGLALLLGVGGVLLMALNAALGAGPLGLGVDALYLGLCLALAAWRARRVRLDAARDEPLDGGEAGT